MNETRNTKTTQPETATPPNTPGKTRFPVKGRNISAKSKSLVIALRGIATGAAKKVRGGVGRLRTSKFAIATLALIKKHKRLLILSILLLGSHYAVYSWANSKGFESGKQSVISSTEHKTKTLLDKKTIPYRSLSGSITELKDSKLTIRTMDGKEATFTTNDKTKYSQQGTTKKRTDLKVGNQVTVFATDNNSTTATHIVIVK